MLSAAGAAETNDGSFKRCAECVLTMKSSRTHACTQAEEAGYHFYRRMLRTSIMGASDDDEEDVLLQKMRS